MATSPVSDSEITEIVTSVWESMLGVPVENVDSPPVMSTDTPRMTGTVIIAGEFDGAVSLDASWADVVHFAACMFAMADEEVGEDEARDAFGELINMVGGNIKNICPQPSQLSLPSIIQGVNYRVALPGTVPALQTHYDSDEGSFSVTIRTRSS